MSTIVTFAVSTHSAVYAAARRGPGHGHGWWHTGAGGEIVMAIIWIVVVALVLVALLAWSRRSGRFPPIEEKDSPLDTLKHRYAKGEISKEEFEEKKRDIE